MRQGIVRALAVCALAVVALAPVATAGAAGDGTVQGDGGPSTHPAPAGTSAITWAQVAERLRARAHATDASQSSTESTAAPSAPVQGSSAGAVGAAVAPTPTLTPTLTVTPSTDLIAGQQVTIAGTGFAAGQYLIAQCTAGGSDPNSCDLNGVIVVTPDASGAFSQDAPLRRTLRLFDRRVDCASAPGTCEVVAINFRTFESAVARTPLSFDPSAPLPNPTIAVTPSTGLLAGQQVTVTGSGFVAGDSLVVSQCAADDPFCFAGFGSPVRVGADGHFTTTLPVHLRVNTAIGGLTNCLAVACVVQAGSFNDPDYLATAPLTFDPNQPLPPVPAITVTPNTALRHDQVVQVHGTGFDPQSGIEISECPPDTSGFCNDYLGDVQADGNGAFDASVPVSRLVSSFDFADEEQTVDCAPGGCSISASAYETDVSLTASAPIAFDASLPPPPLPVVTVTPNSNLPFRAAVAVHGTGYTPGEQVYAQYCLNSPSSGTCGFESGFGIADANGTIDFTLTVRRRVSFSAQEEIDPIDCLDPSTTCFVDVSGEHAYERVRVEVTFDPNAPVPPAPTASVTPDHDLGYRQTVALTGANFAPGRVGIEQCGTITDPMFGSLTQCGGFAQTTADAAGAIATTVEVTRVIKNPFSTPVDCATTPQSCYLRIGNFGPDESATVPLGFDPNSQPPPPPALTITPNAHLFDGQHVTVAGRRYRPGTRVGITECKAGATVIAEDCDIAHVQEATVGADGTFSQRFVTESVLGTSNGAVDCALTPDSCVIAAANFPQSDDFAVAALDFDVPELTVQGIGVTEGTGDMTMAPVHVMLSKPDRNPITVHWIAQGGTASPGTDFASMRGTLTIPAGATEAMIDTEVVADAMDEPTETFRIRVVDALGTRVTDRVGTVTIHDDDAAPTVRVRDTRRREDHGEAQAEVLLAAPSGKTVIVHYVTHHVSARAGSDYVRKDSRLVFLPGETRHLVRVELVNDRMHEATETFHVELDRVEQATATRSVATVTVTDDD